MIMTIITNNWDKIIFSNVPRIGTLGNHPSTQSNSSWKLVLHPRANHLINAPIIAAAPNSILIPICFLQDTIHSFAPFYQFPISTFIWPHTSNNLLLFHFSYLFFRPTIWFPKTSGNFFDGYIWLFLNYLYHFLHIFSTFSDSFSSHFVFFWMHTVTINAPIIFAPLLIPIVSAFIVFQCFPLKT